MGCSEEVVDVWEDSSLYGKIQVGGIDATGVDMITSSVSTRATAATDAEKVSWLLPSLMAGLDITYGKVSDNPDEKQESVAILKLVQGDVPHSYKTDGDYAVYTFNLRGADGQVTTTPAKWRGNGMHYFEGLYVPQDIRYTTSVTQIDEQAKAPGLVNDQSDFTAQSGKLGNYTLLSHYLGMAANTRLQATIERVKLPFRHRLAHVVAYILIDPILGGAQIEGYKGKQHNQAQEDPRTSAIYFRNVQVLSGVKDELNQTTQLHTLTPNWAKISRVTPHFYGEKGSVDADGNELDENFIMYINNDVSTSSDLANIYPSSNNWAAANAAWNAKYNAATGESEQDKENKANSESGYTRVVYGKVPVYDLIVRPTYTSANNVMYDENLEGKTKEQFASLINQIDFDITLDNGLQYTKEFEFDLDANYQTVVYLRISREGVDYNDSGSAQWITTEKYDGYYGVNNQNGNTLSKAGSSWQRAYTYLNTNLFTENPGTSSGVTDGQFYNATTSHEEQENAQYFTETYKDKWVEKFLQAHEGGAHHGDYFALLKDIEIDARLIPQNFVFTGHLDAQDHIITLTNTGEDYLAPNYVAAGESDYEGQLYIQNGQGYSVYTLPQLYRYKATSHDGKNLYEQVNPNPSIAQMMSSTEIYYIQNGADYELFVKPTLYANHPVPRTSPSYLFEGLKGDYTTAQESDSSIAEWEANVHKETNGFGSGTHWVPTLGYRAELLNVKIASPATLFKNDAVITGNVQNCYNGGDRITDVTPALPDYK